MYHPAFLSVIAVIVSSVALANKNNTSTNNSSDASFVDEITFDNDKCDGDPFLITRRPFTMDPTKGPGTQCDQIGASKCAKVDQPKEPGEGKRMICLPGIDAPFSLDYSQTYLQMIFFSIKDTKCEAEIKSRQGYLADGKCRKSGTAWSKVTCDGDEGGSIMMCQDDKCENCQKLFAAAKHDTCYQNGGTYAKTLCSSMSEESVSSGSNTTNPSNSSKNINLAPTTGLSFSAFVVTLFATFVSIAQ